MCKLIFITRFKSYSINLLVKMMRLISWTKFLKLSLDTHRLRQEPSLAFSRSDKGVCRHFTLFPWFNLFAKGTNVLCSEKEQKKKYTAGCFTLLPAPSLLSSRLTQQRSRSWEYLHKTIPFQVPDQIKYSLYSNWIHGKIKGVSFKENTLFHGLIPDTVRNGRTN